MSLSQPVGPSLPENKSCIFYKLMVASILQDKKLKIPNKFVKKFRDELSSIATVSVPGGRRWLVELREDNKRIWLDSGWNAFVKYYSICIGYFLIFKYEGNSHFDVHVYDLKTSEINYREFDCNPLLKDVEDGDFACSDEEVDEYLDHDRKKHENSTCLHRESDLPELRAMFPSAIDKGILFSGVEITSTGDEGGACFVHTKAIQQQAEPDTDEHESLLKFKVKEELPTANSTSVPWRQRDVTKEEKQDVLHAGSMFKPESHYFVQVAEVPKLKKPGRKKQKSDHTEQDSSAGHEEDDEEMRVKYYESASARKRTVTAEERKKAINAARSFESGNPFFRVILRPSYLYRGCIMYLPCGFAEKYLSGVSENIKLQLPDGRQWSVRCIYRGGKAKFHQGWYEFALENNLGEGDVCVFELLESTEFVLKVTVFRVTENAGSMHQS